jgi:hypothetical protein
MDDDVRILVLEQRLRAFLVLQPWQQEAVWKRNNPRSGLTKYDVMQRQWAEC